MKVNTTTGPITIPRFGGQITLAGRESKILVSDYTFGKSLLRYSTAEVSVVLLFLHFRLLTDDWGMDLGNDTNDN